VRTFISWRYLKETITKTREDIYSLLSPRIFKTSFEKVWEALKWMPTSSKSIVAISFINEIFIRIVRPFTVIYVINIVKLSPYQYGIILLISSAVRALLLMPLGILVDTYGRRKILLATLAFAPVPVYLFVYSRTFWMTLTLFIITMIVDAVSWPAFSALTADMIPKEKRGRINAAVGESGVFIDIVGRPRPGGFLLSIAALLGSSIGGYIYELNPTFIWQFFSLSLVICFVLFAKFVHEPEKYEK
jgi:MFS family permease